jgi:hypothetical protein
MNISLKTRYVLIATITFVVSVLVFGYIAIPSGRHLKIMKDANDLRQEVGPFDMEDMEAVVALRIVVDSAPRPLRVRICKELARKRVTIKTAQRQTVGHVLGDIAVQLQTGIGDEAEPHFRCRRFFDDSILIEKHQQ